MSEMEVHKIFKVDFLKTTNIALTTFWHLDIKIYPTYLFVQFLNTPIYVSVLVIRRKEYCLTDIVSNEDRRPYSFRRITDVKH